MQNTLKNRIMIKPLTIRQPLAWPIVRACTAQHYWKTLINVMKMMLSVEQEQGRATQLPQYTLEGCWCPDEPAPTILRKLSVYFKKLERLPR